MAPDSGAGLHPGTLGGSPSTAEESSAAPSVSVAVLDGLCTGPECPCCGDAMARFLLGVYCGGCDFMIEAVEADRPASLAFLRR